MLFIFSYIADFILKLSVILYLNSLITAKYIMIYQKFDYQESLDPVFWIIGFCALK